MKWKVRLYLNTYAQTPFQIDTPIGMFRNSQLYPNIDGQKGWYFDVYTDGGSDPSAAIRDVLPDIGEIFGKMKFPHAITEVVVFNVNEIFRSDDPHASAVPRNEIIDLKIIPNEQLFQRLFQFPHGIKIKRMKTDKVMMELIDFNFQRIRQVTQPILDEIKNNC